jgi:iron complex outermembrane receptor protein
MGDLEIMPSARLLWRATDEHSFWGAVSRAVRTPSVAETDILYHMGVDGTTYPLPLRFSMQGNTDMESQTFQVWEFGYRFSPSSRFFLDTSIYLTQGDDLYSASFDALPTLAPDGSYLQLTSEAKNDVSTTIYGTEVSVTWVPMSQWKLRGWYSYCEEDYSFHGTGTNSLESVYGHTSPRHQFFLRSSLDLPHDTELDLMGRYVSELDGLGVPDYFTVDAQLSWRPSERFEISLVGKNLVESRHVESSSGIISGSSGAVERSCFLKLRLDY